jgi:hypothetical protein
MDGFSDQFDCFKLTKAQRDTISSMYFTWEVESGKVSVLTSLLHLYTHPWFSPCLGRAGGLQFWKTMHDCRSRRENKAEAELKWEGWPR